MITWEADGFRVELQENKVMRDRNGRKYFRYAFFDAGRLVFSGRDFSPSPLSTKHGDEYVVADYLPWALLRPGDTDDEFFERYTERQMAWCQSQRRNDLQQTVEDLNRRLGIT